MYVSSGKYRYAFVLDENLWEKVKEAVYSGPEFDGWGDDDFAEYFEEECDEESVQAVLQADGAVMSEVEHEWEFSELYDHDRCGNLDWGDNPKFLTPLKGISAFNNPYGTPEDLLNEYKTRLKEMGVNLPEKYQYAWHICEISTVSLG